MTNFKPELTEAFEKASDTAYDSYVHCLNAVDKSGTDIDPRIMVLIGLTSVLKAKFEAGGDIDPDLTSAFAPLLHFLQKRYEEENKKDAVSEAEDIINKE